jgi:hypothetical protein
MIQVKQPAYRLSIAKKRDRVATKITKTNINAGQIKIPTKIADKYNPPKTAD